MSYDCIDSLAAIIDLPTATVECPIYSAYTDIVSDPDDTFFFDIQNILNQVTYSDFSKLGLLLLADKLKPVYTGLPCESTSSIERMLSTLIMSDHRQEGIKWLSDVLFILRGQSKAMKIDGLAFHYLIATRGKGAIFVKTAATQASTRQHYHRLRQLRLSLPASL